MGWAQCGLESTFALRFQRPCPHLACLVWETLPSPMVGSSGLEPPTSRLSGVRSNHLSYEPMSARTPVSCLRPARFPGSFRGSLDSQVSTVSSFSPSFTSCRGAAAFRQPFQTTRKNSGGVLARHLPRCAKCLGGDEQTRTVDPLLARQVLSQLSYTPIFTRARLFCCLRYCPKNPSFLA